MTKILFLGSNWEALSTLSTLVDDPRFEVVGLITQPDKPVGRDKKIIPSEIKSYATEQGIPVFHTLGSKKKYKEASELFNADLVVCKSFGEMVPGSFLKYPKFGSINVHYSLLPKYRGAVPIQKAILEGEKETGITYVKMVSRLDAGPILRQYKEEILDDDTNESLRHRLVEITHKTIGDVLEDWVNGKIETYEQDDELATYCQQDDISKENAYINWETHEPELIERMIRALIPWPIAWTYFEEKLRLKIFRANLVNTEYDSSCKESVKSRSDLKPGEYAFDGTDMIVGTKDPKIIFALKEVQLEGKTKMDGKQFCLGKNIKKI